MRCQALLLAVLLMCSLSLVGYIHSKRKEELKLAKQASFQSVKHRVTRDVLKEYQTHVVESTSLLDKTERQIEELKRDVLDAQVARDKQQAEAEACTSDLKHITDEVASLDSEMINSAGQFKTKNASLQEQISNLKKEVEQGSKVCDHIKKDSVEGRKLCNLGPPPEKKEETVEKVEAAEQKKEAAEEKKEAGVEKKEAGEENKEANK